MAHNKEVEEILIARRWFKQIFNDDYTLNEKATLEYLKKLYIDHGDKILRFSEERQKLVDEKTDLEISLKYEEEKLSSFNEELTKLKDESSNMDDLKKGTLSDEEEKVLKEEK